MKPYFESTVQSKKAKISAAEADVEKQRCMEHYEEMAIDAILYRMIEDGNKKFSK